MIPDLTFVTETFRFFNRKIFMGYLPLPRFRLTHARTFRGKLAYRWRQGVGGKEYYDYEMRISLDFDLPQEEWEDVVIHEMIHLFIAHNRLEDSSSHGPLFRRKMEAVNKRYGRHVTVSSRMTEEQRDSDDRIRGHYLCLAKFSDGRLGVAPVAKTRIFDLWNMSCFFPNVVSVRWIGTTDTWFNRFPRVMKPKLYVATAEEITPHLKGAILLGREGNLIRAVSRRCSPDELLP